MSLGKAAVYKHIPVYYPNRVGPVGGVVGLIGGLGGFILPIVFGMLNDLTGIRQSCFMLLFLISAVALVWMHMAILRMEREAAAPVLAKLPELPEMQPIHGAAQEGALRGHSIADWRPEDPAFWETKGRAIARRNLWVSIPCLLLAFAVWMVWSVVVAKLPAVGFRFDTGQLFWLAALPGLSGATLRIFYSFMPPVFGGRLWTTLSTWSLMIPALGIGFAVQNPATPYWVFLALALLCGFGGGNFASSMANISFFFPKREKGNALALNAGLGNLGVSVVQFVVPLVITAGVFGAIGGDAQAVQGGSTLWLQNAGFVWVPFIAAAAFAAWFKMDDLASMKASFSDQAVIFQRKHNWIMCFLYTGTFGSFIGYSAGFPLLARTQFPEVDALQLVFLGPLVGALADRLGVGQVGRRARQPAGVHGDGGRRVRRHPLHRHQGAAWRLLGLLRLLHVPVLRLGRGQCQHLPDDPCDHGQGHGAVDARGGRDAAPRAGREGECGHHRLHLRHCGLRRLLHPQELRHRHRHDRQPGRRTLGLLRLLPRLHRRDLGRLHAPGRAAARRRARPPERPRRDGLTGKDKTR